jgi:hypothetical protein
VTKLSAGSRLKSQVCTTQIIVIKAPGSDVELTCGGRKMVDINLDVSADSGQSVAAPFDLGSELGKRYVTPDGAVELLVTQAGSGSLAVDETPLEFKAARLLPASD